jgi:tetratricopeptide (TPR) repeat protein
MPIFPALPNLPKVASVCSGFGEALFSGGLSLVGLRRTLEKHHSRYKDSSMARLSRFVVALSALAALVVLGSSKWSQAADTPDTPEAPKAAASKEKPTPEAQAVQEAFEFFKVRKYKECEQELEKAAKKFPETLPPAPIVMAQLFAGTQQAGMARGSLERAVKDYPTDPEAYVTLGTIAVQEGRVTEASAMFNKALDLLPNFKTSAKRKAALEPQTISGLAAVAERREEWAPAQSQLERLLKVLPEKEDTATFRAQALLRLARVLFKQQDAVGALKNLRAAYDLDKKNVLTPEAILGSLYQQVDDDRNAGIWMANALRRNPEDPRTRLFIGQWSLETDQFKEAREHAEKAIQLDPKSAEAKNLRGVVALFEKKYSDAAGYFESVHLQSPGNFAASNNLALALCEQEDKTKLQQALEYANNNFQANPKSAEAASTLCWVLYKAGDIDRAERAIQVALQSGQGNMSPDTAYYLAEILSKRDKKEEAKNVLKAILTKGANGKIRPFAMRPEAQKLLTQLESEPAPKASTKKDSK